MMCNATFMLTGSKQRSRFTEGYRMEIVRRYVEDLTPYRVISRRISDGPTAMTCNIWVHEFGLRCMSPLEASMALRPEWGGTLGLDGKYLKLAGMDLVFLLACDLETQDIVNAVVAAAETRRDTRILLEGVKALDYPIRGIVKDLSPAFSWEVPTIFPGVPTQASRFHLVRYVKQIVPKSEIEAHLCYPHLPADNNITENIISWFNRKLKLMKGFKTLTGIHAFVNLMTLQYRFKRFTDSRIGNNGLSPLELAGLNISGVDWLAFGIRKGSRQISRRPPACGQPDE